MGFGLSVMQVAKSEHGMKTSLTVDLEKEKNSSCTQLEIETYFKGD
mgnify:CR=1 FL=1